MVDACSNWATYARSGSAHDHASLFASVGLWLEYGGELSEAAAELTSIPTHRFAFLFAKAFPEGLDIDEHCEIHRDEKDLQGCKDELR